jgi:hypothetical protein
MQRILYILQNCRQLLISFLSILEIAELEQNHSNEIKAMKHYRNIIHKNVPDTTIINYIVYFISSMIFHGINTYYLKPQTHFTCGPDNVSFWPRNIICFGIKTHLKQN